MFYFTNDQQVFPAIKDFQTVSQKLMELHTGILPRVRNHNLDLHPSWQKHSIVTRQSVATLANDESLVLSYYRSQEAAHKVERLMGKERVSIEGAVDTYCHPVIELRLTRDYFAIELIVSPKAWWDQTNLIGKLELPQHRAAFRNLLCELDADYRVGFWSGTHLDDMHLPVSALVNGRIVDDWMNTFCDGQDWLRIGKWYDLNDSALDGANILNIAFDGIKKLNNLYNFILWTSNNNFHEFYNKRQRLPSRMFS